MYCIILSKLLVKNKRTGKVIYVMTAIFSYFLLHRPTYILQYSCMYTSLALINVPLDGKKAKKTPLLF